MDNWIFHVQPGDLVRYENVNDGTQQSMYLAARHLELHQWYTLESITIHDCHTHIHLKEFPGVQFNSVSFQTHIPIADLEDLDGANSISDEA